MSGPDAEIIFLHDCGRHYLDVKENTGSQGVADKVKFTIFFFKHRGVVKGAFT